MQKLAEDVKAKYPELIYLNLRTIPPGQTESFKVASSPPSRGGKSDAEDLQVEHTGKPIVEQIKAAPQKFRVLLPLRETKINTGMELIETRQSDDQELLSGLIRIHVLYHACKGPIFGLDIIEKFQRRGYKLSPGLSTHYYTSLKREAICARGISDQVEWRVAFIRQPQPDRRPSVEHGNE